MKELIKLMNSATKTAFKTLVDLFGEPDFILSENASKIIEKFNEELAPFYDDDVRRACLSLYKWRKCNGFPTINHILSELIDVPKRHEYYEPKEPPIPESLKDVWHEAMIFFTATRAFISTEVYDEAMEMFNRLKFPFFLEAKFKVFNTFDKFVFNKRDVYNYQNDYLNYVLAFKNGAFDALRKEFKENLQTKEEIRHQIEERNAKEKQENAENRF